MSIADDIATVAEFMVNQRKPGGDLYLSENQTLAMISVLYSTMQQVQMLEQGVVPAALRGAHRDDVDGDKVVSFDDWRAKRGR